MIMKSHPTYSLEEEALILFESDVLPLLGFVFSSIDSIDFFFEGNPGVLEIREGGWGGIESNLNSSIAGVELEVTDADSEEGWDLNSSRKLRVKSSNIGVNEGLEFFLEGSSIHSEGGGEVGDSSNGVL